MWEEVAAEGRKVQAPSLGLLQAGRRGGRGRQGKKREREEETKGELAGALTHTGA